MTMAAPSGPLAVAANNLANSLAASATFRTWVGASKVDEALERIHFDCLPPPASNAEEYSAAEWAAMLPLAIVYTVGFSAERDSDVGYESRGTLQLHLIGKIDASLAALPHEAGRLFDNVVGGIIRDLEGLAGQAGYLTAARIKMHDPPTRGRLEESPTLGDLFRADLFIDW